MFQLQYVYLIATIPALVIWLGFYLGRKDLRREMLSMSLLIGFLSVATSYYWWTVDWWHPLTITGTKVGIEDFLIGFGSGGIMAVSYEVLLTKRYSKRHAQSHGLYDFFLILLILSQITSFLFYVIGLTSFYASSMAMLLVALAMFFVRRDLIVNGIISGLLMAIISVLLYGTIFFVSSGWIDSTYYFNTLSGIRVGGVPVEEFVFWFLSGLVFGPFYEFWRGLRLKKV
ncbi:MAG: hypothetical protein UX89_C0005G0033 [Parcubacteria group bacterium GW2011_GWA2_47_16]|nr:MAG: hypothetical protein UX89_C0005G0033 [Parcubacteria group bacterium GW2011_GWA2_47_16]